MMPWYFKYKPTTSNNQPQASASHYLVNILLVPAGDARNQGRSLEHQFESSITLSYVQALKVAIEKKYPEVHVIISHKVGEIVRQYQVPAMANALGVDFAITFNCYHEQGPKPELYIYHFSYGDDFINKLYDLSWYTVDSAYLFSKDKSAAWAAALTRELNADAYKTLFAVRGPFKLPVSSLLGMKVPALNIEMSLKQDEDWEVFVDPLVISLEPLVRPLITQRSSVEAV
jgi:hypothetical protein